MNVLIESAVQLDKAEQTEIEKIVAKKVENAEFTYKVNAAILGGLRVTVGSKRIDLSLSGRLGRIAQVI